METSQTNETTASTGVTEVVSPSLDGTLTTPETAAPVVVEVEKSSKLHLIASVVVGLLILLGAGYFVYSQYYKDGGIVAVVNGKEIYQKELADSETLIRQNPSLYGVDPSAEGADAQIKTQALELLITNAILLTAASNGTFDVTDEDIQGTYNELIAQLGGEEELKTQMAAVGLTDEKLKNNIRERELVDKYLEAETDIENIVATEAEVTEFIAALKTNNIELPPLEEVMPQIEAQIISQKQQQMMAELIERLKGEATIEIK